MANSLYRKNIVFYSKHVVYTKVYTWPLPPKGLHSGGGSRTSVQETGHAAGGAAE